MKLNELRALKKLKIKTRAWGDGDRVWVRSSTGRYTYVGNVSKRSSLRGIVLANPKAFAKSSSIEERIETLKSAYQQSKNKMSENNSHTSDESLQSCD
jgi:hypothetical protein